MNSANPILAGKRVLVRRLKAADAEDLHRHLGNREIGRWLIGLPQPYTRQIAARFIRWSQRQSRLQKEFHLGIVLQSTQKVIGGVGLKRVDTQHRCAELGFWIGKPYWNQGLTTEAARLLLDFGFRRQGLHRIYAHTFDKNIASRRVLEKCGFQLEGVMREAVVRHHQRRAFCNYGILKSEYRNESVQRKKKRPRTS
ncbi:MAG: GNAT family N-acetyltransferase [Sedimentisphaerales bacterium]|nr:GNAT family N-acetyltransferase [Sedimentisphaerales bacterium]